MHNKLRSRSVSLALAICTGVLVIAMSRTAYHYWLNSRLFEAIRADDAREVRSCLRVGASANAPDSNYERTQIEDVIPRVLHGYERRSPTPIVEALDVQTRGPYAGDYLPENTAMIEALLDYGADLRATGHGRHTPLQFAARLGYSDTVRLILVRGGAAVTRPDEDAAIVGAALAGDSKSCEELLAHGASPNACEPGGFSALMCAAAFPLTARTSLRALHLSGRAARLGRAEERMQVMKYREVGLRKGRSVVGEVTTCVFDEGHRLTRLVRTELLPNASMTRGTASCAS